MYKLESLGDDIEMISFEQIPLQGTSAGSSVARKRVPFYYILKSTKKYWLILLRKNALLSTLTGNFGVGLRKVEIASFGIASWHWLNSFWRNICTYSISWRSRAWLRKMDMSKKCGHLFIGKFGWWTQWVWKQWGPKPFRRSEVQARFDLLLIACRNELVREKNRGRPSWLVLICNLYILKSVLIFKVLELFARTTAIKLTLRI